MGKEGVFNKTSLDEDQDTLKQLIFQ